LLYAASPSAHPTIFETDSKQIGRHLCRPILIGESDEVSTSPPPERRSRRSGS
jgi:hypothetical protein